MDCGDSIRHFFPDPFRELIPQSAALLAGYGSLPLSLGLGPTRVLNQAKSQCWAEGKRSRSLFLRFIFNQKVEFAIAHASRIIIRATLNVARKERSGLREA